MEPVNNCDFQVLNCPNNNCNFCGNTKRYCYDAEFCVIKQQIIYNWALLGVTKHYLQKGVLNNKAFEDIPQNNIDLLNPYPHKILKEKDFIEETKLVKFKESV